MIDHNLLVYAGIIAVFILSAVALVLLFLAITALGALCVCAVRALRRPTPARQKR
ncbi:hypothetical protein J2Y41_004588 [Arthrobacter sp. 1088]|uniref:hypothetical protein n=1 Tax=Arthrobacter sp. 1088 TaxID=2817768 RepID=UPI00285B613B|nr:hypothetical protein [Arthrobacter sp. 1088]MDR6688988.1 hypothetical protein [Arthrobacter sp. 1088]